MTLGGSLVDFLHAYEDLSELCSHFPWGTVSRSSSLRRVHDANRAWVFGGLSPSIGELREAVASAQSTAPVSFTQVEVLDIDERQQLMAGLARWLGRSRGVFAFMATDHSVSPDGQPAPPGTLISEQPFPNPETFLELIRAGHADEHPLPEEVLRELVARDTTVFAPAGARFFAGYRDGKVIGYASLLSLHGVGLVDSVATLPQHRRRGVASAVVGAALIASADAGNAHTCLFTLDGGGAQRIYGRLGLRTIARAAQFHKREPIAI